MNNEKVISEIKKHLDMIKVLVDMETVMPSEGVKSREIINSERYNSFFRETDIDKLLSQYTEVVSETAKSLGTGDVIDRQFIVNVLEYGRFLGMYENMENQEDGTIGTISYLSQSGLNIALLGKSVCASQARFMRDLLQERNIKSVCSKVTFVSDDGEEIPLEEHDVTLFGLEGKYYYADPTWYNGTQSSLKGSNGLAKCYQYSDLDLQTLEFSQEEIEIARRTVGKVAIEKLGIDKIVEQLGLSKLTDLDKQTTIMAYLEKQAIIPMQPVSIASVDINGFEVEVGKAFELFLQQQGVPYQLHEQSKR